MGAQYFLSGKIVSVTLPFMVDGNFVSPQLGTVYYTLRNTNGTVITGYELVAVPISAGQTDATVAIASSVNIKSGDLDREKRTVVYQFTYGGATFYRTTHYWLTDWLNHSAGPDDVRAALGGVAGHEVRDHEIDLAQAYFAVKELLSGGASFNTSLGAGTMTADYINQAITTYAAIQLVPILALRIGQREVADQVEFHRFQGTDLRLIETRLRAELSRLISLVNATEAVEPTLMLITADVDPVTGA